MRNGDHGAHCRKCGDQQIEAQVFLFLDSWCTCAVLLRASCRPKRLGVNWLLPVSA